ncbi:MAG TPA: tRNA 4-thiouridine(8) synthase ThiI [Candidatus Fimihabitans intestinipullorum]|uniref:Probable tRNA sulfurtransferase n=1 Tax=Candidatus Fimihabitans intestinipullorum TaxID=2840820 RepID=A0A9D1HTQ8_9BACT|nr:tRNA 4-thiouridine(8) synthase ThiI [Candidatus Fimihabitans intestinipullorum]
MEKLILIKYGELTTKKGNRNFFISTLTRNIEFMLRSFDVRIEKDRVRMYIYTKEDDLDRVSKILQKVFGLHGIVICYKVETKEERIEEAILQLVKETPGHTFKVETKRADKRFPIPSMEYSRKIGGLILKNTDLKVDVHEPDFVMHVEIRPEGTFLYTNEIAGAGGYPVGIQGKGLLMLSGGIDSPVAGYLTLKRGVDLECLYFESPPHTSEEAKNKVLKLASIINEYSGHVKVHVVPFTKLQEAIYKNCPPTYMITIMRRMMYRIAERVAHKRNCKIIVNGESIGQVASQTLESMVVINAVTNMPVIRPVACLDKLEIIELANKIGTYETSILPYEDCCTIFLPKHPVIHPELGKCIQAEAEFDYESLIDECVENIETISSFDQEETEMADLL